MLEVNRRSSSPKSIRELLGEIRQRDEIAWARDLIAVPTRFSPLDKTLGGGLRSGELVLLGGVPGVGKTNLTLQWARNVAIQGVSAAFCCYEHDEPTLLLRLMAMEIGEMNNTGYDEALDRGREHLRAIANGQTSLAELLATDPLMAQVEERMSTYADRLHLVRCSGVRTDLETLGSIVQSRLPEGGVLFVDYLQKVAASTDLRPTDRITATVEGLKDLSLDYGIPVVSVVAAEMDGLESQRLQPHHLRGSAALVYECDVLMLLNNKYDIVSKAHLAYDTTRAQTYREYSVFTIEKNRGGPAPVDLEFRKDFANYRYYEQGGFVHERLVDERLVTE